MTKTNSLKKALAGILAACMAATTLVAAPFTIGGSSDVSAASLDEMELLAQYSFESGYVDSVSGESGTLDETTSGTVSLEKDGDNTYMSVGESGNYNNAILVDNPFYGTTSDMTIAMKVRVNSSNDYQGLWAIIQEEAGSWVGLCGTGGFHYNYSSGYADYTDYNGTIPVDSQWHEVVTTVTQEGVLTLYVDGDAVYSITDSAMLTGFTDFSYLLIGAGCSSIFAWGSSTADYDDVRFYSGAADADAVESIYDDDTPDAVASWDFEDGIDSYTTVGTVTAEEDEYQGNVANVADDYSNYTKSYLQFDNPLQGRTDVTGITVSMNVLLTGDSVNAYEGLFGFMNGATSDDGFFGAGGDGSLHYNECFDVDESVNNYFDTALSLLSLDSTWHKLAVTVTNEGYAYVYVDGVLASTVDIVSIMSATDTSDAAVSSTATATTVLDFILSSDYFNVGIAAGFWGSAGASYDNVAIYDTALTALQIANLPGTVQTAESDDDDDDDDDDDTDVDTTQPYLLTKDAGKWQVIDGNSINTTAVSVETYAAGQSNYSIYGWYRISSTSANMHLYEQLSTGTSYYGSRLFTNSSGYLTLVVENADAGMNTIVTSYNVNNHLDENFFLTVNYDYDNNTVTVYVNGESVASPSGILVAASSLAVSQIYLGYSMWDDPVLDGRIAELYYSNSLLTDITSYMEANPAPDLDQESDAVVAQVADRENLQIVEIDGDIEYGDSTDDNGNPEITYLDGDAKAMLSTEQYTQETLATNDVTTNAGYREYDVSAFLENADDFSVTAWVRWYGDGSTAWGGTQTLTAQRFFDLFNIEDGDESDYEFYFNGWEEDYYTRNPSVSTASELQEGIDELTRLNNNPNVSSAEASVYLCGITAGATLNGLNRPCFRPGLTFVANGNQTNSGLPYQWAHIAVVYDSDGHVDSDGNVCGASLTYYVDGAAYAVRYFDYYDADITETVSAFYQNNSDPKNAALIGTYDPDTSSYDSSQVVGGSLDGADVIYGLTSEDQLKVKNMALDTLYLGKSTDSTALWNGQYQNAYIYNYSLTSSGVAEDYSDFVQTVDGVSYTSPETEADNPFTLDDDVLGYALVTEEEDFSKTMELGFNAEWLTNSALRDSDSLSFNGDGGYVEVPVDYLLGSDGNVSDQLTFSTWISVNESVDWGRIFDIKGTYGELLLSNYGWFNDDADVGMGLRSATLDEKSGIEQSHTDTSIGQYIPLGSWVNVTVVIDGLDVAIYFQGELQVEGELEMTLSEMGIDTFYLSRSAAVDGKYGLPLDADNNITMDETYLFQTALDDDQVYDLMLYGYTGLATSTIEEDSSRLEMIDVADLFDAEMNVDVYYVDITESKILSADVMNALANSTGKTLYVRVMQGVSYDFIWELTSEAFAGNTYTSADEFDLLVTGEDMSDEDATTILTKWSQLDPTADVTLQAQTITVYADQLPVSLNLFINYGRDFLNTDGTTLTDATLNLYKGTASDYTLVTAGLQAATGVDGEELTQDYTNPSTSASGTVTEYYVQALTEGGTYILTTNTLP